jgi:hypothetical protein
MGNYSLKNGLISGGVQVGVMVLFYFISAIMLISFAPMVCFFVYLGFMRQTVVQYKREKGGYISFKDAFRASWLTFIPGSVILAVFNYLLFNFMDPHLLEIQREILVETFEKMATFLPMSDEEYDKQLELLNNQNPYGLQSLATALPLSFLFPGALIAAIMALIMKKEPTLE